MISEDCDKSIFIILPLAAKILGYDKTPATVRTFALGYEPGSKTFNLFNATKKKMDDSVSVDDSGNILLSRYRQCPFHVFYHLVNSSPAVLLPIPWFFRIFATDFSPNKEVTVLLSKDLEQP